MSFLGHPQYSRLPVCVHRDGGGGHHGRKAPRQSPQQEGGLHMLCSFQQPGHCLCPWNSPGKNTGDGRVMGQEKYTLEGGSTAAGHLGRDGDAVTG